MTSVLDALDPNHKLLETVRANLLRLDLRRHKIEPEAERPGPATIDMIEELMRIHDRLCEGAVPFEDSALMFELLQAMIYENQQLKMAIDELKAEFVKLHTQKPSLRLAAAQK